MKIAGGCFGCLTLILLILSLATSSILTAIYSAQPDLAVSMGPISPYIQYVNSSCCCLSGLLTIVFLAVGFMSGKKDEVVE